MDCVQLLEVFLLKEHPKHRCVTVMQATKGRYIRIHRATDHVRFEQSSLYFNQRRIPPLKLGLTSILLFRDVQCFQARSRPSSYHILLRLLQLFERIAKLSDQCFINDMTSFIIAEHLQSVQCVVPSVPEPTTATRHTPCPVLRRIGHVARQVHFQDCTITSQSSLIRLKEALPPHARILTAQSCTRTYMLISSLKAPHPSSS